MSHKVKEEIPLWHTDHLQSTHTNVCSGLLTVLQSATGGGWSMCFTLSEIFTKRLKPSADLSSSLPEMFWQKSFALVLDSTSKACTFHTQPLSKSFNANKLTLAISFLPHLYRQGSRLCGRSVLSCVGWLPLPPNEGGTFLIHFWKLNKTDWFTV